MKKDTKKSLLPIVAVALVLIVCFLYRTQKDNFHFEVSPYKLCGGGAYMRSSDPTLQKLCDSLPEEAIARSNCCPGFNGQPLGFERTPMSNNKWENTMCGV